MSKRDYYLCDCCNEKCFYDADIPDRFEQAGKIKAICKQCAETHTISIDGKAVAANIDRLDVTGRFGWGEMVKDSEGPYILFSDHQQALTENVALYAKQVGEALERLTDDFIFRLAEKDHAYQQLMEKAARFAEAYRNVHLSNWIDLVGEDMADKMAKKDPVYVEAQAFLNIEAQT